MVEPHATAAVGYQVGYFIESEREAFVKACREAAEAGTVVHAYTPYPVHGLENVLGYPPSWIGRAVLAVVLLGFAVVFGLIWQNHVIDWPINVSGKPYGSWQLFILPTLESGLLFGALANLLACFHACRLAPNPFGTVLRKDLTDDHFALVLRGDHAADWLRAHGAESVEPAHA